MDDAIRTMDMYLFRLKLEPHQQKGSLGETKVTRHDLLLKLLKIAPSYLSSEKSIFHISKLENISPSEYYFKVGVESKSKGYLFSAEDKNFIEKENRDAQYANCLYESNIQLLAIENKVSFLKPKTLATRLALAIENIKQENELSILDNNEKLLFINSKCKTKPVYEAYEFAKTLHDSYKITKYSIDVPLSNPVNFRDDVQVPLSKMMGDVNAETGTFSLENKTAGLSSGRLIDLSHDLGAYGASASARIMRKENSKSEIIKLGTKAQEAKATLTLPTTMFTIDFKGNCKNFMLQIKEKFNSIRGNKE